MDLHPLRRQIRARRRSLTDRQQRQHAQSVALHLLHYLPLLRTQRIGAYLASDGELDLLPTISGLRNNRRQIYLPVLHPLRQSRLWFARWREGDVLVANRFGINEPSLKQHAPRAAWQLDALLLPLVGFDMTGRRLGMGGGFYDRSLARCDYRSPLLIGVAHDLQRVDALPDRPWDVPLDAIVTESGIYVFK